MPAAHHTVPSTSFSRPQSSHCASSPRRSREATQRRTSRSAWHRQGATGHPLSGVSHPKITKDNRSRASRRHPGSEEAVGKGPGGASASGQAAVRLSKAELRRNASLDKWVATAAEEDKLARRVNRDFSDGPEPAAQPAQQRPQPPAKVLRVPAMKKRKVYTAALCAGFVCRS